MNTVLVVVGPTASGKSGLAVKLARSLNGEVISADSRQVYRGLDIGSGKVTKSEMNGVPHHLLDVASPKKVFTASDYKKKAEVALADIQSRGKLPIICGGTGFYVDALVGRIDLPEVPIDQKLRDRLEKNDATTLFKMLQKKDPARAKRMNDSDRQNPRRLVRALEIMAELSHQKTEGDTFGEKARKIPAIWIGIQPDLKSIERKIHIRLIARMKQGMVREATHLHAHGVSWKRMEQLGLEYRYLALYLQKKMTKDEMLIELERRILQYAKRQITYWKRNKDIRWFEDAKAAEAYVTKIAKIAG